MLDHIEQLIADLGRAEVLGPEERMDLVSRAEWIATSEEVEIAALLASMIDLPPPTEDYAQALWENVLSQMVRRWRLLEQAGRPQSLSDDLRARIAAVYQHLGEESLCRHPLLALLAVDRKPTSLRLLAELIADDPPQVANQTAVALSPLFQRTDYAAGELFPRLLDGLPHLSAAAAVLDLANFVTRQTLVERHPGGERLEHLTALLTRLTEQLELLEETSQTSAEGIRKASMQVAESLSLAVSLCDALGLIGDRSVTGRLYRVLDLSHRRLRTEAAAALARLGEEEGERILLELAAEPVARLRVLAYAQEMNLMAKVEEQFRTLEARAEAELAVWLAEPTQLGFPPTTAETIDQRDMYWPGYDEKVRCLLVSFSYEMGESVYRNIGIVGPITHAFTADLTDLPHDDVYAAYAGWQAEHEEITETPVAQLNELQRVDVARLERRVHDAGYDRVEPAILGFFFGDRVLAARAHHEGEPGVVVADVQDLHWFPVSETARPLGPHECFCIYKGRKLLRTFND